MIRYLLPLCFIASSAFAADYTVDPEHSKIRFSGTHADEKFEGEFETWTATISFDPDNLKSSMMEVAIQTASAQTGNAMYDGTLPKADWFATEKYPEATFKSDEIIGAGNDAYHVKGTLTMRGISQPAEFTFTAPKDELAKGEITTESTLKVDRLAYDIGKDSDGEAEWVSREIQIMLFIKAEAGTKQ